MYPDGAYLSNKNIFEKQRHVQILIICYHVWLRATFGSGQIGLVQGQKEEMGSCSCLPQVEKEGRLKLEKVTQADKKKRKSQPIGLTQTQKKERSVGGGANQLELSQHCEGGGRRKGGPARLLSPPVLCFVKKEEGGKGGPAWLIYCAHSPLLCCATAFSKKKEGRKRGGGANQLKLSQQGEKEKEGGS